MCLRAVQHSNLSLQCGNSDYGAAKFCINFTGEWGKVFVVYLLVTFLAVVWRF